MNKNELTIGLHVSGISSSCAIVDNGKVLYAGCEERYSRIKYDKYFPTLSMQSGLSKLKLKIDDIKKFAISWNPAINIKDKFRPGFSEWPAYSGARLYSIPNRILSLHDSLQQPLSTDLNFHFNKKDINFEYINHHESHAAFAYYASGFSNADVLINDGYGENASSSTYTANGSDMILTYQELFPNSIGMLYATITQFLGFKPNFDEWKVMGAAAYGEPKKFESHFNSLYTFENGKFTLDLSYFRFYDFEGRLYYSNKMKELLGENRTGSEVLSKRHYDIAASLQRCVEKIVFEQISQIKNKSNSDNLCLSGGVAMNCLLNGFLSRQKIYKHIYVPFSPDDSGNAIGAALLAQKNNFNHFSNDNLNTPYLGDEYSNDQIKNILDKFQIKYEFYNLIENKTASLLAQGKIIGWFQGRMEFGQRALGNRSILADPRDVSMKDKINSAIKYRENFRPFAPSVLEEDAHKWFELEFGEIVPFMEKIFPLRKEFSLRVPAVCHQDGSARLQTVSKKMNLRFHKLIEEFKDITGVPILINTSFNINKEPIVECPEDAIKTFYTSGLDALVLGNFIIIK